MECPMCGKPMIEDNNWYCIFCGYEMKCDDR